MFQKSRLSSVGLNAAEIREKLSNAIQNGGSRMNWSHFCSTYVVIAQLKGYQSTVIVPFYTQIKNILIYFLDSRLL